MKQIDLIVVSLAVTAAVFWIRSMSSLISASAMTPLGSINSVVLAFVTMDVQVRRIDAVRTVQSDKQLKLLSVRLALV